jgi:hypothetical protein
MTIPFAQHFDARLPATEAAVRITSIYDAQIFTRRWVIRQGPEPEGVAAQVGTGKQRQAR